MKFKKSKKIITLSLIAILLVGTAGFTLSTYASSDQYSEVGENENPVIKQYTIHDPIRIDGNTDFSAQGWPGSGTEEDPYIIEGFEIDGSGEGYGIYVGNTTVHFEVRENYVHSASGNIGQFFWNTGLILRNVQNGRLTNNTVTENGRHGIYLTRDSAYNIISGNEVNLNSRHGIFLDDFSNNNQLIDNTANSNNQGALNNDHGINLVSSSHNTIRGNEVLNNYNGIRTSSTNHNILSENHISGNDMQGILLVSSNNNLITWNHISSNGGTGGSGVRLFNSNSNSVYNNNIVDNNSPQGFDGGDDNVWNTDYPKGGNYWSDYTGDDYLRGPDQDITGPDGIGDTPYTDIDGGTDEYPLMYPTEDGYILRPPIRINSNADFISANGVTEGDGSEVNPYIIEGWKIDAAGLGCGIYVGNTTMYFVVRNNFVHDAGGNLGGVYHRDTGIYLWNAENGSLVDNILDNNDSGIRLTDSRDNNIEDNEITGRRTGIALRQGSNGNLLIGNNVNGQTLAGVIFYDSDENQLIENEIMNNLRGIYFDNSNYNDIWENSIFNNDEYGIYFYRTSSNNSMVWNTISNSDRGIHISEYSQDNTIDGNTITSTVLHSVYLYRSSRNTIQLNTISSNSGNGIRIHDSCNENLLRYNTITDNLGLGIAASSSHFNFIGFNNVSNNEGGISLIASNDNTILDNTASSNTIDHGIYLLSSHRNSISENTVNSNKQTGIYLSSSLYNSLGYNTAVLNQDNGIWLNLSHDNDILENDLQGNYHGIYVLDSDRNELSNNSIFDSSQYGIYLERSEDNDILDNIAIDNMVGLVIWFSDSNTMHRNTLTGNSWYGFLLSNSHNNTISYNIASSNNHGLYANNCNDNLIESNDLSNNLHEWDGAGVLLRSSLRNTIRNNDINSNTVYGIFLWDNSYETIIEGNTIDSNGYYGIRISSKDNVITDNTIKNNYYTGIFMWPNTDFNVFDGNTISDHIFGVYMHSSTDNVFRENTMANNGIFLIGSELEQWDSHEIDTTNTVNGKPVQYLKGQTGGTVPAGAGQVILADCVDVTIENQDVSYGTVGIQAGFSEDITITGNNADWNSYFGIYLYRLIGSTVIDNQASHSYNGILTVLSEWNVIRENTANNNYRLEDYFDPGVGVLISGGHNNTIEDNTASENEIGLGNLGSNHNQIIHNTFDRNSFRGIEILHSYENHIEENTLNQNSYGMRVQNSEKNMIKANTISDSEFTGISLLGAYQNTITENYILNNQEYGIYSSWSESNVIYRNVFIGNVNHSYEREGSNYWDAGDPELGGEGGNYWDDYLYIYPDAEDRGDGIGDTPYEIQGETSNYDLYPWIEPEMVHPIDSFDVSVDDINAGELPLIIISGALDMYDNPMDGVYSVKIEIDGGDETIELTFSDGSAQYVWSTMTLAGDYTTYVTIDEISKSDIFTVSPNVIDIVSISPDSSQTMTAGDSIDFSAEAFDEYGNLITDDNTEFTWVNADDGFFDDTTAGTYEVTASYDGVSSDPVTVTVEPAAVDTVSISPDSSQTMTAGDSIDFSAEAFDEYGNLITDLVTDFTWDGADANGVFNQGTAGEYQVTATYNGVTSDPTILTVTQEETFTLVITTSGEGSTYPSPGDHDYDEGTHVTIEAVASDGWYFSHWTGDYLVGENEEAILQITMDSNKALTAHFVEDDDGETPPDDDDDETPRDDIEEDSFFLDPMILGLLILAIAVILALILFAKKKKSSGTPPGTTYDTTGTPPPPPSQEGNMYTPDYEASDPIDSSEDFDLDSMEDEDNTPEQV